MSTTTNYLKGVIHGKAIELRESPGLPEGQEVTVLVQPLALPGTEGILRSAGACTDEADDLDAYLQWNREQRKRTRTLDPSRVSYSIQTSARPTSNSATA